MVNRDLVNNIEQVESIRPQVANGAVNGETVDLRGCDSVAFVVSIGAITGSAGNAAVTLEESSDDVTYTAVADADILGSEPEALAADTDYRFGYIGNERYVRAVFALGGETDVAVCAMAVKGDLNQSPEGQTVTS